jgi:hypothetical protein
MKGCQTNFTIQVAIIYILLIRCNNYFALYHNADMVIKLHNGIFVF